MALLSQTSNCSTETFTLVYPSPAYVPYAGGTFPLGWRKSVFANCPSQAVPTVSWIFVNPAQSPANAGSASYTVPPGESQPRTGTIRISSVESTVDRVDFTVIQAGQRDPVIQTSIPGARVGVPYSVQLTATSPLPSGPFEWSMTNGPPGLTLSPTGLLSGTPFVAGRYPTTVTAILPGSIYRATTTLGLRVLSNVAHQFFRMTPCRVMDTRAGSGKTGNFGPPALAAGFVRAFSMTASDCSVPANAVAYSLNVTVVPHEPLSYLSLGAAGDSLSTSVLNSYDGAVVANAAILPGGISGDMIVFASNATDVIIDINGYFAPPDLQGLAFYPVPPCRLADTRAGSGFSGSFGVPALQAGATRDFPVPSGSCGIPSTAQAYSLNMTVVPPAPMAFLSTWPAGQPRPLVSTLNSFDGRIVANAAIVPAGAGGAISTFASHATDLVIDVNGYFAPPGAAGALSYYLLGQCRAVDTRPAYGFPAPFGPPSLPAGGSRSFALASTCGVPSTAQAYALNVTAVPQGPLYFLSLWPTGMPRPFVSTLNSFSGNVVANAALVPAGTNGAVSVFVTNAADVLIDVNAFFAP